MYKLAQIRNYLLFPIILYLTLFLFYGCTKIDTHIGDNVNSNDISFITNKFFETSVNVSPITLTIINEIKKRNTKNEFVTAFAKNNGYPVWDKAIIKTRRRESNTTSFANSVATNDSFALIPFVLADSNFVNGYIFANISDSINLSYSLAKDYKAYPFTLNPTIENANKFALRILLLNKSVFGNTEFQILDKRLFSTDTIHNKTSKIILRDQGQQTNVQEFEVCVPITILGWYCGTPDNPACKPRCDYCGNQCHVTMQDATECTDLYPTGGGGGGPTGGGGTPTGGSGGGGTTGIPYNPPPCNPNPINPSIVGSNVVPGGPLPPCPPPSGGPGWVPIAQQLLLDLQWMNDRIKDSTNNICVAGVLNTFKQLDTTLPSLIRSFFDTSDIGFYSVIKTGYFGQLQGGNTDANTINDTFQIKINSYFELATDLSIATTIIHEYFHCQLYYWFRHAMLLNDTALQNKLAREYGYLFTKEISDLDPPLSAIVNGLGPLQHQDIAVKYNTMIANAIYAFAQKRGIYVSMSFCKDLAWTGTSDSRAYNSLSTTQKNRIEKIVKAEKDPTGVTINPNQEPYRGTPCF